jgi:hypothetical protein
MRLCPGHARLLCTLITGMTLLVPGVARAQLFFASRPEPPFTIGPLMIRAKIDEGVSTVTIHALWSLVIPTSVRPAISPRLYLLWPGEMEADPALGKPDPALARFAEERGFAVVGGGRLGLFARNLAESEGKGTEPVPGGAPFVVFVQEGGGLGLSPPATLIRIPWSPRMNDRGWLMDVQMKVRGLIKPRKATWVERLFIGGKYLLTMSFHEVRTARCSPCLANGSGDPAGRRRPRARGELCAIDRLWIDRGLPADVPPPVERDGEHRGRVHLLDKTEGIRPSTWPYSSDISRRSRRGRWSWFRR